MHNDDEYKPLEAFLCSDQFSSRVIYGDHCGQDRLRGMLYPKLVNFGNVMLGAMSPDAIVTVENQGSSFLPIKSMSVPNDFSYSTDCPIGGKLEPGQTCSVVVNFKPGSLGVKTGGLYVDTGDAMGGEFTSLSGSAVPTNTGVASLSVPHLVFPATVIGHDSATQQVVLTNIGANPLTVSALAVVGDFSAVSAPALPQVLAANASVTLTVKFSPQSKGQKGGQIQVTHNGTGGSNLVLSGFGSIT